MREVRRKADALNQSVADDHQPYRNAHFKGTYFRLPSKPPQEFDGVNVTPTCTAFMSLTLCGRFDERAQVLLPAESWLLDAPWDTGKLPHNNAFTTTLILRSTGYLYRSGYLSDSELRSLRRTRSDLGSDQTLPPSYRRYNGKSVRQIATTIAAGVPESLRVGGYPPSATIAYWLFDAIWALKAGLRQKTAEEIVNWSVREFLRQVSMVSANDHTRMDPIALAMAACVCRLLRRLSITRPYLRNKLANTADYPTDVQLRSAIDEFLERQNGAGVWEKYFPIFHYPGAGPNHCWHFEVLEAVVNEFPEILASQSNLQRIEKSLDWLADNRLTWRDSQCEFFGWNSGGDFVALQTGQPESWPTGVAHMCLWRLRQALSIRIRELVLRSYGERVKVFITPDVSDWRKNLDCKLPKESALLPPRDSVKGIVKKELLAPVKLSVARHRRNALSGYDFSVGPDIRLTGRMSALLFGPPGTSKTSFAEAVAHRLGWPFLELSPSDFLRGGLPGIYDRVNEVFTDLLDLFGVVILFDEMDALVQSREDRANFKNELKEAAPQLDITQKFLTTSMLPKLLKLRAQRRTVFFMATNHQREFDPAIKRKGRFDLLIRMGPPSYEEKIKGLEQWIQNEPAKDRSEIATTIRQWTASAPVRDAFDLFTYGEVGAFFDYVRQKDTANERLLSGLKTLKKENFEKAIGDWEKNRITLRNGTLNEYNTDDAKVYPIQ
jgi:hypothetical protein